MNIFHTLRRIALVLPSSAYPASWPIALMRIATGIFFSTSGFNKLVLPGNRAAMLQTVTEVQVPCPELMAPLVAGCECLLGLLLALGLGTRPAALVLFAINGVALAPSGFTRSRRGSGRSAGPAGCSICPSRCTCRSRSC
ncbi:DoxX family protein [Burkholderia gladioli]|uniref:DoxX family protein n=2 Tax=Burkholderia gladioli TaxID=28095 RepID=UPI001ABAC195|nr:DoxX family protein [Burkholderia gladioli]